MIWMYSTNMSSPSPTFGKLSFCNRGKSISSNTSQSGFTWIEGALILFWPLQEFGSIRHVIQIRVSKKLTNLPPWPPRLSYFCRCPNCFCHLFSTFCLSLKSTVKRLARVRESFLYLLGSLFSRSSSSTTWNSRCALHALFSLFLGLFPLKHDGKEI